MQAETNAAIAALYDTPEFKRLASGRRTMRIALMAVSMAFFFSQPVLFSAFPALFKMRITDSINVGLVYLVAQYAVGGAVAVLYAVCQARFDRRVAVMHATKADTVLEAASAPTLRSA